MKKFISIILSFLLIFTVSPFPASNAKGLALTGDSTTHFSLGFEPSDSEIDPDQPIVYFTDMNNKMVHAINYLTGEEKSIQFNLWPERIAYANGEIYVTLLKMMHSEFETQFQGAIAVINAATFTKSAQFDINTDPYDIQADNKGFIYVSPGSGQLQPIKVYSRATGSEVASVGQMDGRHYIQLHPTYQKIYSLRTIQGHQDIETYVFNNGSLTSTYDSPYNGEYSLYEGIKISPDGKYLFNPSGDIFNSSNLKEADMTYAGKLDRSYDNITFDAAGGKIYTALISGDGIGIYDSTTFTRTGTLPSSGVVIGMYYQNNRVVTVSRNADYFYDLRSIDPRAAADSQVLSIMGTSPSSSSATMPIQGTILVKFSENILPVGQQLYATSLTSPGDTYNHIAGSRVDGDTLIIDYNGLDYGKQYNLTVRMSGFTGYLGSKMPSDYVTPLTTNAEYTRLYGNDRYETSVQISQKGWNQSDYVVLATGENFPDALCAAPLAAFYGAPILLTEAASLNSATDTEIARLKAKHVFIAGGPGVISNNIESYLKSKGITVTRLYGESRYETSLAIAKHLSSVSDISEIVVATGENFPDALSIASYAAYNTIPILLTETTFLPFNTRDFIKENNVAKSYVIGGNGVVSDAVMSLLPNAERIAGANRYETNLAVIFRFKNDYDFTSTFVATGENFPDALSGSALAGLMASPVILADWNITSYAMDGFGLINTAMKMKYILGGPGVVPDPIVNSLFKYRG